MTKELIQEVEEIVSHFRSIHPSGLYVDVGVLETEYRDVTEEEVMWLRQQLTSLAEKAEEQGVKKATSKAGWPAVVIEGWMKKGAQEMKEKAIACVNRYFQGLIMIPAPELTKENILTALQALTDE